ncbi:PepSY domain-containing protein [Rhodopseudomonas palustris]|nr:PepSY domain-containing protein [Rhodopseudomonas palustris]
MFQHGVVALFGFRGRYVADGLKEPSVVEPVDPFQGGELDGLDVAPWPASPLTAKLFQPIIVNARDGRLDRLLSMPWYLRLPELSRPLHFGDYGRLHLKIVWAALDVIAIIVPETGVYLWLVRGAAASSECRAKRSPYRRALGERPSRASQ